MKLTASQIGRIAHYCELVCKKYPTPPPSDDDEGHPIAIDPPKDGAERVMEPWEVDLKKWIDEDTSLPAYEDPSVDQFVEDFISYFA